MSNVQTVKKVENEEPEDLVESMLKKTGCIDLHYKVQECIAETQDWRKCQHVVNDFRKCMSTYTEAQRNKYK